MNSYSNNPTRRNHRRPPSSSPWPLRVVLADGACISLAEDGHASVEDSDGEFMWFPDGFDAEGVGNVLAAAERADANHARWIADGGCPPSGVLRELIRVETDREIGARR